MNNGERYHVRRANGICGLCPAPVDGEFWKCFACRVREAEAARMRRYARKSKVIVTLLSGGTFDMSGMTARRAVDAFKAAGYTLADIKHTMHYIRRPLLQAARAAVQQASGA